MEWAIRFSLSGLTNSYSTFRQVWEVIKEKDGMKVSYRWFRTKEKAEAFGLRLISGR